MLSISSIISLAVLVIGIMLGIMVTIDIFDLNHQIRFYESDGVREFPGSSDNGE